MDKPLVSICLKAYNQKDFIGEALESVLKQTYRPLEIVICDDHSTDGTWEIIREKVDGWRLKVDSGVSIALHRNETNLGNAKNWEMCGKLAHGALLVKADGDDISLPERTEKIVAAWLADGKRAKVVTHAVKTIPGDRVMSDQSARRPLGAGMAWSKDCFEGWPEVGEDCRRSYDDVIYSLRGLLLGTELVMKDVLVRYRQGSGETSVLGEFRRPYARSLEGLLTATPQKKRDLEAALAKGWIDAARYQREMAGIAEGERINGDLATLLSESVGFWRKLRALYRVREGFNWRGRLVFALFTLPPCLSDRLMKLALRFRAWVKRERK